MFSTLAGGIRFFILILNIQYNSVCNYIHRHVLYTQEVLVFSEVVCRCLVLYILLVCAF